MSAEKHVRNEQTSSNMSRNSRLKNFLISCDTNKIALHVIKQCYARGSSFILSLVYALCRLHQNVTVIN